MAGKVARATQAPGPAPAVGDDAKLSASLVNSFRVIAVVDRLALHLQPGRENNSGEFVGLCLSLARGIDYAVSNNELPSKVHELPLLLKQVCRRKNDHLLDAAIMVLMISIKNACKVGWFSVQDTKELFSLASEIGSQFRSSGDINDASTISQTAVSTVFSRYYPRMKMGAILASLEVEPGFGAYVLDFHISKKSNHSPLEKILLFVAQTNNLDTSACLVSPPQVNFLMNGTGVDKRTNIQVDTGPQLPTNVTGILKYGTNLLQAVGTFNGNYVILVAFVSTTTLPDPPVLLDYVQSDPTSLDTDSDVIEGPSRISLNCPISLSRIKIPVKGSSCKHLQCFDFGNYVEINSKRPSWRCPHCNQNVSYTDIRIDQNIVQASYFIVDLAAQLLFISIVKFFHLSFQVLKEVGDNITHVNISADGSWKAIVVADENEGLTPVRHSPRDNPEQPAHNAESPATPMVLDLTEGSDDLMDELLSSWDTVDRKPSQASFPGQTVDQEKLASEMGDWAHLIYPSGSGFGPGVQNPNAVSQSSSMRTDVVPPMINSENQSHGDTNPRSQFAPLSDYTSMQVPVHRVPTAVQALPAQGQYPFLQQRPMTSTSNVNSSGLPVNSNSAPSVTPTASGFTTAPLQRFSKSFHDVPRVPSPASYMPRQTLPQNFNNQFRSSSYGPAPRQTPVPTTGLQRASPSPLRMPSPASNPTARSSSPLSRASTFQQTGVGSGSRPQATTGAAQQAPPHMHRQPLVVPVQMQSARASYGSSPDISRTPSAEQRGNANPLQSATTATPNSEQNWRPASRMRGSLEGRNLAEIRNLVLQSTHHQNATGGAASSSTLSDATAPPHLRGLFGQK
ncbi:E4 SUMO-protein ligase PIAL2 [Linum perenne]